MRHNSFAEDNDLSVLSDSRLLSSKNSFAGKSIPESRWTAPRQAIEVNNFLNLLDPKDQTFENLENLSQVEPLDTTKDQFKNSIFSGNFVAAAEIQQKGFCIAPKMLFQLIYKKDLKLIQNLIKHSLYSRENVEVVFWVLIRSGFKDEAKMLWEKERELQKYGDEEMLNFEIDEIANRRDLINISIDQALEYGLDDAACSLIRFDFKLLDFERLTKALKSGCLEFLKVVWTGDLKTDPKEISKKAEKSDLKDYLICNSSEEELENIKCLLKATSFIKYYLNHKRYREVKSIVSWPMLKNREKILKLLIESNNSELTADYILSNNLNITKDLFCSALLKKKYEVCYAMLKVSKFDLEIKEQSTQKYLIEHIEEPFTSLLFIETMNRINIKYWKINNIREVCLKLNFFIKKRKDLIYCSSPLLFCVLVAEFMKKIESFSKKYRAKCISTKNLYLTLATYIEKEITDEDALKFYLSQKDSLGRTVLEIIARKEFFELLDVDSVGLLVEKFWTGNKDSYSIFRASSVYETLISPLGSEESLQFRRGIDPKKYYSFQLSHLVQACSTRFLAFGIADFGLITLYYIFLFLLVENSSFLEIGNQPYEMEIFGIVLTLIFGISCEQILRIIYNIKSKKKLIIDLWKINDWIIAVFIVIMAINIPLKLYKNGHISSDSGYLANCVIYSIMLFFLCMKFWSTLITSSEFGPLISTILIVIKEVHKFLIIYSGFILCSSTVFTLLFKKTIKFEQFDISLVSLFTETITPFNFSDFSENKTVFGAVVLGIFVLLSHVLLFNLLIGIVSNVYRSVLKKIKSRHRSVLITKYYENKWNDFGFLIMLPTPFNAISLISLPAVLKDPKWNQRLTKIFYPVYGVPYFLLLIMISFLCLPLAYVKGFYIYGNTGKKVPEKKIAEIFKLPEKPQVVYILKFSYFKSLAWIIIGPFWLVFAVFRDCFQFWKIAYLESSDNFEETVPNPIHKSFIKSFHKILASNLTENISANAFYEKMKLHYKFPEDQTDYFKNFLSHFSPENEGLIDCRKIVALFPRKTKAGYDEEYLEKFKNFRLQNIYKGLSTFQKAVWTSQDLRKKKMNTSSNKEKFYRILEQIESKVEVLQIKTRPLLIDSEILLDYHSRKPVKRFYNCVSKL